MSCCETIVDGVPAGGGGSGPPGPAGANSGFTVRSVAVANVNIATLANGSANDGLTLNTGELALLPWQTAPAENGIYLIGASGPATRITGLDASAEFLYGAKVYVQEGNYGAGTVWELRTASPNLGVTSIEFDELMPIVDGVRVWGGVDIFTTAASIVGVFAWGNTGGSVTSTNADGGQQVLQVQTAGASGDVRGASGLWASGSSAIRVRMRTLIDTAPSVAEDYNGIFGLAGNAAAEPTNGIYFWVSRTSATPANWFACTANGAARTRNNSGVAVAYGSYQDLEMRLNTAGTNVDFFINRVRVAQNAANIPSGANRFGPRLVMFRIAGSTARNAFHSYYGAWATYAARRAA